MRPRPDEAPRRAAMGIAARTRVSRVGLLPALVSSLVAAIGCTGSDKPAATAPPACTLRVAAEQASLFVGAADGPRKLATDPAFARKWASEFNSLTTENQLKWAPLSSAAGVYDWREADELLAFAEANGMRVRGHALVWHRMNGLPDWLAAELDAAPDPEVRLRELMTAHIATTVSRYRGRVAQWDVVNEPHELFGGDLDESSPFHRYLGPGYVAEAFRAAHAADPDALLFLNETSVEWQPEKLDGLVALVKQLLDEGVPIDGVGLQAHFLPYLPMPSRDELQGQIEAFAALGLIVEFTELDIGIARVFGPREPLAWQADRYRDVFEACLAVPACTGITTWGVGDGDTWLDDGPWPWRWNRPNRPLLFDFAYAPKPAHSAVCNSLLEPRSDRSASLMRGRIPASEASGS